MAIHETDGTFTISSGGAWLPGIYATKKAARWAFQFPPEGLEDVTERVVRGEGRAITTADLSAMRGEP